jgi:hypothetical protein
MILAETGIYTTSVLEKQRITPFLCRKEKRLVDQQ